MKKHTLLVTTCFLLLAAAQTNNANAQTQYPIGSTLAASSGADGWTDRSDELPGISSGKSIALLSGAVLGVVVASHFIRSNRKKAAAAKKDAQMRAAERPTAVWNDRKHTERLASSDAPPVNLILGLPGTRGADSKLTLGFSVEF